MSNHRKIVREKNLGTQPSILSRADLNKVTAKRKVSVSLPHRSSGPCPSLQTPRKILLWALMIWIKPGLVGWRINGHTEMRENRED